MAFVLAGYGIAAFALNLGKFSFAEFKKLAILSFFSSHTHSILVLGYVSDSCYSSIWDLYTISLLSQSSRFRMAWLSCIFWISGSSG
jgi:hypothetical protein